MNKNNKANLSSEVDMLTNKYFKEQIMGIIKEPKEVYLTIESRPLKKDEVKLINDYIKSEKSKNRNTLLRKKTRAKSKVN